MIRLDCLNTFKTLIKKTIWYYKSYPMITSEHDQCEYYRNCNKSVPIFFFGLSLAIIFSQILRAIVFLIDKLSYEIFFRQVINWIIQDVFIILLVLSCLVQYKNSKDPLLKTEIKHQYKFYIRIQLCGIIPSIGAGLSPLALPQKIETIEYMWLVIFLFELQACTWLADGVLYKTFLTLIFNTTYCLISVYRKLFTTNIVGRFVIPVLLALLFFYAFERYKKENFVLRSQLSQQKKMYEKVLESAQDPMIILSKTKILFSNRAAFIALGISELNLISKCENILNSEGISLYESIMKILNTEEKNINNSRIIQESYNTYNENSEIIAPDKTIRVTLIPTCYFQGEKIIALEAHDMTEELKQEQRKVEKKYKNMLLFSLSHELRTPLNVFQCFLDASRDFMTTPSVREMRKNAKGAWTYLKNKISDILDYAQIMNDDFRIHPAKFSLSKFIEHLKKTTWNLLDEKKQTISLDFSADSNIDDDFYGDRERLEQVLFNLLINAVHYTGSGKIALKVCFQKPSSHVLEFSVSDTGCGMSPEAVSKLFVLRSRNIEPESKSTGLSGLGLTTCKLICNKMGTELKVLSELGKGSKFYFTIVSLTNYQHDRNSSDSWYEGMIPTEGVTANICRTIPLTIRFLQTIPNETPKNLVLIVDDNGLNRYVAKSMVQKMGLKTEEAENGLIAVNKTEKFIMNPNIRQLLILMDINMPVMDGIEATIEIRKKLKTHCQIIIVALTAFSAESERSKCVEAGMDHFLSKPITKDKLKILLETLQII